MKSIGFECETRKNVFLTDLRAFQNHLLKTLDTPIDNSNIHVDTCS